MRKVIVLLVLVIIAASAGAYVYFYQPFAEETALESVLPGDTVGFVRFCGLKKQIERFRQSRMGRSFSKIDLDGAMAYFDVSLQNRNGVNWFVENAKSTLDSTWFDILFGKDVLLAVRPASAAPDMPAAATQARDPFTFVVVARPKQPARLMESLNSMFSVQSSTETETYRHWEIKQVMLDNTLPVYYAHTSDLLIMGFSGESVKQCLDQSETAQTSLLNTDIYKSNAAGLYKPGTTDMVAFLDGEGLREMLARTISQQGKADPKMTAFKGQLDKIKGIRDITMVSYDNGGPLVQTRAVVGIDRDKLSVDLARALSIKPTENPTLKNVPSDALVYSWQNTLDLKLYWQSIRETLVLKPEKVAELRDVFARKTGMPLETVLDALGTQAGLLVNDITIGGMLPIPELALFIEVKKQDVIDQLIRQQAGRMNLPLQSTDHHGVNIHYATLPVGGNLSPAYACKDGFCTLAINKTLLTAMLDAESKKALASHPDFKSVDKGLSAENNQVVYLRTAGLTAKARDLANMAMMWMALAKPDEADKTRHVVENAVYPLLDGLSMIKVFGSRVFTQDNRIQSDMFTLLDRT